MSSRWTRLRIVVCVALLALGALRVGRRAYQLQVVQADELRGRAEDQYSSEIEVRPQRGRILDRNRSELAGTAQFDSIFCNPRQLLAIPGATQRLAQALGLDGHKLTRTLESKRFFAWVKRTVTPEESTRVRALALPGVGMRREPKRVYPRGEVGATVVGHATIDGTGVEGLEKAWDAKLRGTSTRMVGIKDGHGRELLMDGLVDRRNTAGEDVVLSLDSYLMYVTHTALAAAVKQWNAKGGVSVVMDPGTGEILAMASVPTYDPATPGDAVAKGFTRNRAVTDILEPGSTMKTFTLAATLDAGKVKPTDMFDCQSGRPLVIGKTRIHDLHPAGILSAAEVYQHSNNIGTVKIARQLGKQKLYEALLRFGFGRRTGVGLEGEVAGLLHPVQKWGEVHFANIAFGQGLAVTPLQMVAGYAVIANGGIYKPPRLALELMHADGREESLGLPPAAQTEHRVISEQTAHTMLDIMKGVATEHGTAIQAAIDGYEVAGKTGTAQKVVNGHYGPWIGSFIGMVPADKPRLVIAVIIDQPEPEHRGGMVAAPTFKKIAEAALRYLAVPPSAAVAKHEPKPGDAKPEPAPPPRASKDRAAADEELAEGPGSDQPIWSGPEGMDDGVVLGDDDAGDGVASNAEVEADDREGDDPQAVSVPSFAGMTMGEAVRVAHEAGVEIAPEGSGVAVAQSPAPGSRPRGTLCRVSFRPGG